MQRLKKPLALVLAVCLLIGVPMSVDVAAVGKPDATDLTITQAFVIPDSWGVDPSIVAPNKGLLIYFTGNSIHAGYDNPTLYYAIKVTICNDGNWSYGNANGSPLSWNCDMIINNSISAAPNNFVSRLNSSLDPSLLPTSLTAAQKAKYTSAIDTLDEIFMLAEDLGGKVQYRLFELGTSCTADGFVENCYETASGNNVKLTGQIKVNDSGVFNGGSDARDCAIADVVRLGDNATELLKAEFIEDENAIKLTLSEGLSYGYRGNTYTQAGLAVINGQGQIMSVNGTDYKTDKAVTDGSLTGYTKLYYDGGMTFEQVLYNGNSFSVNKCFLNATQLTKYREMEAHAAALQTADPDGGYQLCYVIADVTAKLVAARGESNGNHFVDAAWGANSHPLYANYSHAALGIADMAAQPIVSVKSDTDNDQPLTLKGVFINPKADTEVVLTFSEPIKYTGSLDLRIYPVDANSDNAINSACTSGTYWWVKVNGYYGNSTNQLIGTLKQPGASDANQSYKDVVADKGHLGTMHLALWDSSWVKVPSNGYVDAITSLDGTKHLTADKTAERDVALVPITQETVSVEKIRVLNDTTLAITWSEGVTEGIYRNDATTWKSIRLTNDLLELQKDTAGNWLQYGGSWLATDDPAVWHFSLGSGQSVSAIANMIKPGGAYEGLKMTFAIEQLTVGNALNNILENITSLDGVRPVTATNDGTAAWGDGSYTQILLTPTPYLAIPVSDTQVRIRLAHAGTLGSGTVTIGEIAATAVTAESDTGYLITFPAGTVTDTADVNIPAGLFTGVLGEANEAITLHCSAAFDTAQKTVTLDGNTTYSFMNADTGREIAAGTTTEFTPHALGNNVYTFTANGQYLDLTGATAALTDREVRYQIKAAANERYILYVTNSLAVQDTDGGNTTAPSLGLTEIDQLSIGWYLTKAGQSKPLRILPIGDSITYGTNPDTVAPRMGWRDDLSKTLTAKLDRFVFVGNQTTYVADVDSDILTRHDGNPGWTVKDHGDRNGIYDLVPGIVGKYDPDVVLLMIGINDMAAYSGSGFSTAERDEMKANYRDLLAALSADMDDTDTIFCSRLTPMSSAHSLYSSNMPETFNDTWDFNAWVEEWAAEGLPVVLNDNYAALSGKSGVICSDGIHLSLYGDTFIGQNYANSLMSVYDRNGNKRGDEYALQAMLDRAHEGDTVTLDADYDATDLSLIRVPAGVTLDLNGHTVKGDNILVFGAVIDSTQGGGALCIDPRGTTILQPTNPMLPLYDTERGGYRFFDVTVTNKTPQSGEGFVKYGFNLKLGSEDAYRLLLDSANVGVSLSVKLEVSGYADLHYFFNHSILAGYAEAVLGNMARENNFVVTLKVAGLDALTEGTTVTATPTLSSDTKAVKSGGAQVYTKK